MTLLLKNGLVVDPSQKLNKVCDVLVADGKITKLGTALKEKADQEIDLKGKVIMPGLIDMHVHLREPGFEEKETIKQGSKAAVAGGFTAIAAMANTDPIADDATVIKRVLDIAARANFARVLPVGACTIGLAGKVLTQTHSMQQAGAVAFSDDGEPPANNLIFRRILEYARSFDAKVIVHAEDKELAHGGSLNEGFMSTRLGLPGIPTAAEATAVANAVYMAKNFGPLHLAHISTKESVTIIRNAKKEGIPVTCETAPHYLVLTEDAVDGYNTHAKMSPPLRTAADKEALLAGIKDGTIDIIATDHAPHSEDDKDVEFNQAANGIVGLETAVPLIFTNFVEKKIITLDKMVEIMSLNPARLFALTGGSLKAGSIADITVIDPLLSKKVDPAKFYSKGKNTPFAGTKLSGWPVYTLVAGELKFANGEIIK